MSSTISPERLRLKIDSVTGEPSTLPARVASGGLVAATVVVLPEGVVPVTRAALAAAVTVTVLVMLLPPQPASVTATTHPSAHPTTRTASG